MVKMCFREFNAVLVSVIHSNGTFAVHVLYGSPLETILNINELGAAGSGIISFILIKKK